MAETADTPEFDSQDMAEVWDEDNQAPDSMRLSDDELNFDTNPGVYDATRRQGDEDDEDALIGDDLDDKDIVELSLDADVDDEDIEDDPYARRDQVGFHEQEGDQELDEDTELDGAVMMQSPDEVELEDAGDLNNAAHATGSAKRFESSRLSDEEIERLGYGTGKRAADTDEAKSFDPAAERTPEQHEKHSKQDELLDEGVEETFPASDPVSVKHIT